MKYLSTLHVIEKKIFSTIIIMPKQEGPAGKELSKSQTPWVIQKHKQAHLHEQSFICGKTWLDNIPCCWRRVFQENFMIKVSVTVSTKQPLCLVYILEGSASSDVQPSPRLKVYFFWIFEFYFIDFFIRQVLISYIYFIHIGIYMSIPISHNSAQRTWGQTNPNPFTAFYFLQANTAVQQTSPDILNSYFLELTGPVDRREVLELEKAGFESWLCYSPALGP